MLDESQTVVVGSSVAGALLALGVYGLFRWVLRSRGAGEGAGTHRHRCAAICGPSFHHRCYRSRRNVRYERVAHSLDEEEQAFKRTLEMQVRVRCVIRPAVLVSHSSYYPQGDDIDELFEFAHDVQLDQAELEQIEVRNAGGSRPHHACTHMHLHSFM
jgi:hypothetical protein